VNIPEGKCYCRWCERVKPLSEITVCSYRQMVGGFTGVCTSCMTGPDAEKREIAYLLKGMK
jgi:hypothetical protein